MSNQPESEFPTHQPDSLGASPEHDEPGRDSMAADAAFAETQQEMEALQQKLSAAEKQALLAQADLDNYRKRVRREREDELKYANVPLISDLLPVLDNLQRALESSSGENASAGIVEGVKLVEKQLRESLAKRGCEAIDAEGQPFDPNMHEAILQQPSDEFPPGTVLQVTQVGYKMYERVIRPSQVIVSQAKPE